MPVLASNTVIKIRTLEAGRLVKVDSVLKTQYKMVDGTKVRARDVIKKGRNYVEIEPVAPSQFEDTGDGYVELVSVPVTKKPAKKVTRNSKPASAKVDRSLKGKRVKMPDGTRLMIKSTSPSKGYRLEDGTILAANEIEKVGRGLVALIDEPAPVSRKSRKPAQKKTAASRRRDKANAEEMPELDEPELLVSGSTVDIIDSKLAAKFSGKLVASAKAIALALGSNAGEPAIEGEFESAPDNRQPVEALRFIIEIPFDMQHVLDAQASAAAEGREEELEALIEGYTLSDEIMTKVNPVHMKNVAVVTKVAAMFNAKDIAPGDLFVDADDNEFLFVGIAVKNKKPLLVFKAVTGEVKVMAATASLGKTYKFSATAAAVESIVEEAQAELEKIQAQDADEDLVDLLEDDLDEGFDGDDDLDLSDLGEEDDSDDADDSDELSDDDDTAFDDLEDDGSEEEELGDAEGELDIPEIDPSVVTYDDLIEMGKETATVYLSENATSRHIEKIIAANWDLDEDEQDELEAIDDDAALVSFLVDLLFGEADEDELADLGEEDMDEVEEAEEEEGEDDLDDLDDL